ncbi:MAG: hypothetical protein A2945_04005 [Candidatus Liptonbacteria bacterium RIFCSPLOWO2_01_FULL_52_25]|uniref:Uncharacterized protein n=1 Tax=Candidatus Liptonbacteria bacterium RIFCSPLOWO2_01_FULL_52_25 TaxID=1798650 RepID=A0A1G2CE94_9BACT|nr:MAG: hypothetical protein A2945_04005 [Candidatus Liptonbacteria bacterium RIFCSPLOWO2_01_FULL_52_25]
MANQQLVDYIKAQLVAGVGKEAVRAQLEQAGWGKGDIEESFKSTETVIPTVSVPVSPARENIVDKGTKITQGTISVSDLIPNSQLDMAPVVSVKTSPAKEEQKVSPERAMSTSIHVPKLHVSIAVIVLAIVAVALGGGGVYFYMQGRDLQEKSMTLGAANDAMMAQVASLNTQVADLTASGNDLKAQVQAITSEKGELAKNLSFFLAPAGASTPVSVVAKGALSGGEKVLYALTLSNGIRLSVVNSKDAKVDAAFKALTSTSSVEISGTHVPGFRDVTVTAVNGTSVR